jgi:hypothetical protein
MNNFDLKKYLSEGKLLDENLLKPLHENKEAMDAMKAAFLPEGDIDAVIEVLANYGIEDSLKLRTMVGEVSAAYKSKNIEDLAISAIFMSGLVSKLS